MLRELVAEPVFGILLTLVAYEAGIFIYNRTKTSLLHPVPVGILLVIGFLLLFKIDLASYQVGGEVIQLFLGPVTVVLAIPLYRQTKALKRHLIPVLVGVFSGVLTGVLVVIFLAQWFKLPQELLLSLVPKSVTTPIGVEIARNLGGSMALAAAGIIMTGILGAIIGPGVCRLLKIKNKVAVGIAIGTASHAIGTSRALELGEEQGAFSSLAIGLAGLFTVALAPLLINWVVK
ncbi:MAG: LrgB family protein [Methylocystaceae bacterium]